MNFQDWISQKPLLSKKATFKAAAWCGGAGIGSAGLLHAGFKPVCNIDFDPTPKPHIERLNKAITQTYFQNFGQEVWGTPLQRVDWSLHPEVDCVIFSQSCKKFCGANRKQQEDEEDLSVAIAACRGIKALRPKAFVVENVPAYEKSACVLSIVSTLFKEGYRMRGRVLNVKDWGVPQSRKRFILVALRDLDAEQDQRFYYFFEGLLERNQNETSWHEAIADLIPGLPITSPARWQTSKLERISASLAGRYWLVERTGAASTPKLYETGFPAWTIRGSAFTDQKGSNRWDGINLICPDGEWKRLNERAIARLMSVPDWFTLPTEPRFYGPILGNGIPSMFMYCLGQQIKSFLGKSK